MNNIETKKKKSVSFSQYSTFMTCSRKWMHDYLENLRSKEDNIHTIFGTAIHYVIQTYLTALYKEGVNVSDALDLKRMFLDKFTEELKKIKYTEEEFTEFVFNSQDILDTFSKPSNRIKHFPTKEYELIGIEIPLDVPLKNNLTFKGYIDIVLKEKGREFYRIIDFKTSSTGWNIYTKSCPIKLSQVHLYKAIYSKKFNVPLNCIEVEFFILRRALYENASYPQSHIQVFKPSSGPVAIKETLNDFIGFIDYSFNSDGSYKTDQIYDKNPGKNRKNCKFCSHYKKLCDGKIKKDDNI